MAATARYMRRNGVNLPLMPVFCGQHRAFASEAAWEHGIDRFTAAAADLGPQAVALCLTPVGDATDSYAKVLRYFLTAQRVKRAGMTTLAWRQGVLGVGAAAAGLDGYETGIGTGERADVRDMIARRKLRRTASREAAARARWSTSSRSAAASRATSPKRCSATAACGRD